MGWKNETLHWLYIWEEFERCLSGGALHRGGECYVWVCFDVGVACFVGFWACLECLVDTLWLDKEMGEMGAFMGL